MIDQSRTWVSRHRGEVAGIAAALIVLVATFARQSGVPKFDTVWAEDGRIFLACAWFNPAPLSCLWQPYAGYLHLIPRLGALLTSLLPIAAASLALTSVAGLVAALVGAVVAGRVFVVTGSATAAVAAGASLALVRQAGLEVSGNLANLHWFLLAGALVVTFTAILGYRPDRLGLAIVLGAAFSSVFVPILAVGALVARFYQRPRAAALLAISAAGSLAQLIALAVAPARPVAAHLVPLSPASVLTTLVPVLRHGEFGGPAIVLLLTAPPVIGLMGFLVIGNRSKGPLSSWLWSRLRGNSATPVLACALVVAGVLVSGVSLALNHESNGRYAYEPEVLDIVALVLLAVWVSQLLGNSMPTSWDRVWHQLPRLIVPAVVLVAAVGFAQGFRIEARASSGPSYAAELGSAKVQCGGTLPSVTIPISPTPASTRWVMDVPCARLLSGR